MLVTIGKVLEGFRLRRIAETAPAYRAEAGTPAPREDIEWGSSLHYGPKSNCLKRPAAFHVAASQEAQASCLVQPDKPNPRAPGTRPSNPLGAAVGLRIGAPSVPWADRDHPRESKGDVT